MDLRRRPFEMLAGQGEVAARLVHLDRTLAVIPPGQRSLDEDMQAGPGRRDLGIAVEGVYYLPGPRRNDAGFRVAAMVEVDAGEGVVLGEDEAHARHAVLFCVGDSCIERRPRLWVGATGPPAVDR